MVPAIAKEDGCQDANIPGVARKQAAGFLSHSEEPFGADPLHPARGTPHPAGQKINRGAHADDDRNPQGAVVHGNPLFLFGAAQGN